MEEEEKTIKPLRHKAYTLIPHLPGSRRGPADRGVNAGQARICCEKVRDKHDRVIVQEKLDGSCVSVAMIDGEIVPLIRAGYRAVSSHYEQHRLFHNWAWENRERFRAVLREGERLCGEWLAQAHGTRYATPDGWEPFVAFDLMTGQERVSFATLQNRIRDKFHWPKVLNDGAPMTPEEALLILDIKTGWGSYGFYGALEPVEGAVWRVERKGAVDFVAKFVRPGKVDGCYLIEELPGGTKRQLPPTWNWRPKGY